MKKFIATFAVLLLVFGLGVYSKPAQAEEESQVCDVWVIRDVSRDNILHDLIEPVAKCPKDQVVRILLDSPGGDTFAMMTGMIAVRDILKRKVRVHIISHVMSAGVVMAQMGEHTTIAHDGVMYLHPVQTLISDDEILASSGAPGTMRKDLEILRNYSEKRYVDFVVAHSKLTAEEVRAMMKEHKMLTAPEALRAGLVDEINPKQP
jgi:ATP-dependent protease ClpP protease subunit